MRCCIVGDADGKDRARVKLREERVRNWRAKWSGEREKERERERESVIENRRRQLFRWDARYAQTKKDKLLESIPFPLSFFQSLNLSYELLNIGEGA